MKSLLRPEDTKERKSKNVPIAKTLRTILMQVPGSGDKVMYFVIKEVRFQIYGLALSQAASRQAFVTVERVDLYFMTYGTRQKR